MDDGSRSGCDQSIQTEEACEAACNLGGWNRKKFIDSPNFTCEGTEGNLPVVRDGAIRWRYVVIVGWKKESEEQQGCIEGTDVCKEKQRLYKCQCDGTGQ